jgi:hypothetical protein
MKGETRNSRLRFTTVKAANLGGPTMPDERDTKPGIEALPYIAKTFPVTRRKPQIYVGPKTGRRKHPLVDVS